jgi:hypothetical protein
MIEFLIDLGKVSIVVALVFMGLQLSVFAIFIAGGLLINATQFLIRLFTRQK